MMQEWLWRGGPRRWTVAAGLFCGLVTGVSQLAVSGPAEVAVASGLGGGVLFGVVMALVGWPGARRGEPLSLLSPSDRVAVMRAVQQGGAVPDRLAPSVLAFARVEISAARQERRQGPIFFVLPALTIGVAVGGTVAGSVRLAAYFWALTVFFLAFAWLLPGRAERKLKKAREAARLAEDHINGANPDDSCGPMGGL